MGRYNYVSSLYLYSLLQWWKTFEEKVKKGKGDCFVIKNILQWVDTFSFKKINQTTQDLIPIYMLTWKYDLKFLANYY